MNKKEVGIKTIEYLQQHPNSKAQAIANFIGAERSVVNSCLYGVLKTKVKQDSSYRWSLIEEGERKETPTTNITSSISHSDIAKLSRYYLACIGYDDDGLSTFLKSEFSLNYEELNRVPGVDEEITGFEEYQKLLGQKRSDRGRFEIFFGYPCLIRYAKSQRSNWEGYFLEPLVYYGIDENKKIEFNSPIINPKAIRSLSNADANSVMNEIVQIEKELGFDEDDIIEIDEMMMRMQNIRKEWTWKEKINFEKIGKYKDKLCDMDVDGIYNRPILILGEKSRITQGLEQELKLLENITEDQLKGTALGAIMYPNEEDEVRYSDEPIIETLPMNSEQREAVNISLNNPLAVITGPPGTGKSQVISNLIINAAHKGKRVLFTSKNNKAVDVVETRVNSLASRPILLRVGSQGAFQLKLAEYILDLISSKVSETALDDYETCKQNYEEFTSMFEEISEENDQLIKLRNEVDLLEQSVESLRIIYGEDLLINIKDLDLEEIEKSYFKVLSIFKETKKENARFFGRIFWSFVKDGYEKNYINSITQHLDLFNQTGLIHEKDDNLLDYDFPKLGAKIEELKKIRTYEDKLNLLKNKRSLEDNNRKEFELIDKMNEVAETLWKLWIKIQPKTITTQDKEKLSKYQGLLKMIVDAGNENEFNRSIYSKYMKMLADISHLLPCWAVTSLSAKGRIPFAPGIFDLVIFDEASQCDIASALPLLYRAKSAVVIGDPKQLTHITSLRKGQDYKLLEKNKLEDNFINWAYSFNSLFNLAATYTNNDMFVKLVDHHRSHKHIIDFSNSEFYEDELRVATNYKNLVRFSNEEPGVRWIDVKGQVTRPTTGGAINILEAKKILEAIKDLLIEKNYKGSVGVVSPFRNQANLITKLVFEDSSLNKKISESEFLSDTVHKFQGDERDIIIFSPVLAKGMSPGALNFLKSNGNLFNVAITRARAQLIVVGDIAASSSSKVDYLSRFAKYYTSLEEGIKKEKSISYKDLGSNYPKVANPGIVSSWERLFYEKAYAAGFKLIPQYQIEKYTVDFLLLSGEKNLVIEIDGERYHKNWNGELCKKDQLRNQRLFELGYDVIRFWVYQVRDDIENCFDSLENWKNKNDH